MRVTEAVKQLHSQSLVRQMRQQRGGMGWRRVRAVTLALLSAARALAALEERDFVLPEDVKTLAGPVAGASHAAAAGVRDGRS